MATLKTTVTMDRGWEQNLTRNSKKGVLAMATDIHKRAVILAPVDTSALANSGAVEPVTNGYKIKFGNSRVPYARRRHFENKKHPATKMYLAKAADSVARSSQSKYFKID